MYKKRRSTHSIRKEQKEGLQKEIEKLQQQLDAIKLRALVQEGEASYQHLVVQNAILRESIEMEHIEMARVRALMAGRTQFDFGGILPMGARICLGSDQSQRRSLLHALRGPKLLQAKRLLAARNTGMSPTKPYFQEERYETKEGDCCSTRFENTTLCGFKGGIRAVYEAVLQAAVNAEIIISETSGNITVREDDDQNEDNVMQMRLVSQTEDGALLETNLVQFAELVESKSDGEGDYAIVATDFVDEDELYPYRPQERVRRDVTAAMLLHQYVKTSDSQRVVAGDAPEDELVVVVSRLFCTRVHCTSLAISSHAKQQLQEYSSRYAGNFVNCLRSILGLPSSC